MTFGQSRHRRRLERATAELIDEALSAQGPAPVEFASDIELAQSLRPSFEATIEPPRSALVAMRAGLANRQRQRTIPEKRRIAAVLAATVAATAGIGALTMARTSHPSSTYLQAQQSLGNLSQHVKGLESALEAGDPAMVRREIVAASAAADEAQSIVENLPRASSGALAIEATKQRISDVHWLVNRAQAALAERPGPVVLVTTTTTTTAPGKSTTTSTTRAPTSTTTEQTTSTTGPPPTTSSTTTAPTTTSTSAPSSTTTEPPPTTTTNPPTTTTPPSSSTTSNPSN